MDISPEAQFLLIRFQSSVVCGFILLCFANNVFQVVFRDHLDAAGIRRFFHRFLVVLCLPCFFYIIPSIVDPGASSFPWKVASDVLIDCVSISGVCSLHYVNCILSETVTRVHGHASPALLDDLRRIKIFSVAAPLLCTVTPYIVMVIVRWITDRAEMYAIFLLALTANLMAVIASLMIFTGHLHQTTEQTVQSVEPHILRRTATPRPPIPQPSIHNNTVEPTQPVLGLPPTLDVDGIVVDIIDQSLTAASTSLTLVLPSNGLIVPHPFDLSASSNNIPSLMVQDTRRSTRRSSSAVEGTFTPLKTSTSRRMSASVISTTTSSVRISITGPPNTNPQSALKHLPDINATNDPDVISACSTLTVPSCNLGRLIPPSPVDSSAGSSSLDPPLMSLDTTRISRTNRNMQNTPRQISTASKRLVTNTPGTTVPSTNLVDKLAGFITFVKISALVYGGAVLVLWLLAAELLEPDHVADRYTTSLYVFPNYLMLAHVAVGQTLTYLCWIGPDRPETNI